MVYFGTIGQLYKTTSFLVVSTSFHSEMRRSVGNNKETTSLFLHYDYQTKTCNQGNHSPVKTTNLFLQCIGCRNRHGEWPGLGFSSEPEERRKRWIYAVRKDWKPATKHTRICGEHFVSSE